MRFQLPSPQLGELIPEFWLPSTKRGNVLRAEKMAWQVFSLRAPGIHLKRRLFVTFYSLQTAEAMDRFGIDKPDLRYDMELLGGKHRWEVVMVVVVSPFDFSETPIPLEYSLQPIKIQTEPVKSHWNLKKHKSHEKDNEAKTCQKF